MELRTEASCPSYGKEIGDGVFVILRTDDDQPIGFTVLDFAKTYANRAVTLPVECQMTARAIKQLQHPPA